MPGGGEWWKMQIAWINIPGAEQDSDSVQCEQHFPVWMQNLHWGLDLEIKLPERWLLNKTNSLFWQHAMISGCSAQFWCVRMSFQRSASATTESRSWSIAQLRRESLNQIWQVVSKRTAESPDIEKRIYWNTNRHRSGNVLLSGLQVCRAKYANTQTVRKVRVRLAF